MRFQSAVKTMKYLDARLGGWYNVKLWRTNKIFSDSTSIASNN